MRILDPIMGALMRDPVRLPTSGQVIDRAVIERHLLSDPTDPFNRAPLTKEQLEDDTALRARIQEWRQAKKRKQQQ